MSNVVLRKLKEEFRKWYGLISVQELVQNKVLVVEIEALEIMLIEQGA